MAGGWVLKSAKTEYCCPSLPSPHLGLLLYRSVLYVAARYHTEYQCRPDLSPAKWTLSVRVLVLLATWEYVGDMFCLELPATARYAASESRHGAPSLKALREQRHLTQEQLAVATEVPSSTVHNTETSKTKPRPAILRRLARVLKIEQGDIGFPLLA
jgi:DNA-binding XRE family transcriptional regulator